MRNAQYIMFCTDFIMVDIFRGFNYSRQIILPLYYHNRSKLLLLQVYLKNKKKHVDYHQKQYFTGFFQICHTLVGFKYFNMSGTQTS